VNEMFLVKLNKMDNRIKPNVKSFTFTEQFIASIVKKLLSIVLICILVSCQKQEKPSIAFYYWKTIFKLSQPEKDALSRNHVNKIYLRYFDVAVNPKTNEAFPVGVIQFKDSVPGLTIVPVVYIENAAMLNSSVDIKDLAHKISGLVIQISHKKKISIQEIQLDCDWTLNSRDRYLNFVAEFRKQSPNVLLSATIRLHQVKYFDKTKIPKVDKAVLMYYNMGKIEVNKRNSIYDKEVADKYLSSFKKYPLSLDVALPIYSWGIHIRNGRVIGLKSKISEQELRKDTNFVNMQHYFFKAKTGNYKHGIYYKKDDFVKLEAVSESDLTEMASDLKGNLKQNPKEIIIYDLDEFNLNNYDKDIFAKISDQF
jgi:hypothetical protein